MSFMLVQLVAFLYTLLMCSSISELNEESAGDETE